MREGKVKKKGRRIEIKQKERRKKKKMKKKQKFVRGLVDVRKWERAKMLQHKQQQQQQQPQRRQLKVKF